jgi:putative ABC transport system substrate-binding protein
MLVGRTNRRTFIAALGGAVAWPLVAYGQQPLPVIGLLSSASLHGAYLETIAGFYQGLKEAGYVEGKNVRIEYRWAEGQYDKLPDMAADLVRHHVAVIFATGSVVSPLAAKAATATIPIVFAMGNDPAKFGLVASINRPGGNVTGTTFFNGALGSKRLELLRDLIPTAHAIALLINPNNPNAAFDTKDMQSAAELLGMELLIFNAASEGDFDDAFARIVLQRADALIVVNDALFLSHPEQIVDLAARYAVPTMYVGRPYTPAGGLISYGTDVTDLFRQAGIYVGRILNGEKPADLPVIQPSTFQLVINLKAAKALGLTVPESFLLRADEVIE